MWILPFSHPLEQCLDGPREAELVPSLSLSVYIFFLLQNSIIPVVDSLRSPTRASSRFSTLEHSLRCHVRSSTFQFHQRYYSPSSLDFAPRRSFLLYVTVLSFLLFFLSMFVSRFSRIIRQTRDDTCPRSLTIHSGKCPPTAPPASVNVWRTRWPRTLAGGTCTRRAAGCANVQDGWRRARRD